MRICACGLAFVLLRMPLMRVPSLLPVTGKAKQKEGPKFTLTGKSKCAKT